MTDSTAVLLVVGGVVLVVLLIALFDRPARPPRPHRLPWRWPGRRRPPDDDSG